MPLSMALDRDVVGSAAACPPTEMVRRPVWSTEARAAPVTDINKSSRVTWAREGVVPPIFSLRLHFGGNGNRHSELLAHARSICHQAGSFATVNPDRMTDLTPNAPIRHSGELAGISQPISRLPPNAELATAARKMVLLRADGAREYTGKARR